MNEPVTIFQLAEYRLGRKPSNGQDFIDAGLSIMGGCQSCAASLAAYNAYPTKGGYWRCEHCISDADVWTDVAEANKAIFGALDKHTEHAKAIIEQLGILGIQATFEYPGYLSVRVSDRCSLAVGTANGDTWGAEVILDEQSENGIDLGFPEDSNDHAGIAAKIQWAIEVIKTDPAQFELGTSFRHY